MEVKRREVNDGEQEDREDGNWWEWEGNKYG